MRHAVVQVKLHDGVLFTKCWRQYNFWSDFFLKYSWNISVFRTPDQMFHDSMKLELTFTVTKCIFVWK